MFNVVFNQVFQQQSEPDNLGYWYSQVHACFSNGDIIGFLFTFKVAPYFFNLFFQMVSDFKLFFTTGENNASARNDERMFQVIYQSIFAEFQDFLRAFFALVRRQWVT